MLEKMQHILNEACELTRSRILSNEDEKELDSVEHIMRRSLVDRIQRAGEGEISDLQALVGSC